MLLSNSDHSASNEVRLTHLVTLPHLPCSRYLSEAPQSRRSSFCQSFSLILGHQENQFHRLKFFATEPLLLSQSLIKDLFVVSLLQLCGTEPCSLPRLNRRCLQLLANRAGQLPLLFAVGAAKWSTVLHRS